MPQLYSNGPGEGRGGTGRDIDEPKEGLGRRRGRPPLIFHLISRDRGEQSSYFLCYLTDTCWSPREGCVWWWGWGGGFRVEQIQSAAFFLTNFTFKSQKHFTSDVFPLKHFYILIYLTGALFDFPDEFCCF